MKLIVLIILILFLFLISWMWHSLGDTKKTKKITYIVGGLVIVYIITFIVFNIAKIGIVYDDKGALNLIRTVYVILFTIINGYLILPYTFKKINQIDNDEIDKNNIKKSIITILIMVILLSICECIYFKNVQHGILNMKKG